SVADTLQTLELEDCRMKDPDLRVLLPALSQCSLLTSINLYENEISINTLKDLLSHTANLSQLTKELYPAPKEVYNHFGYIIVEEFSQCCAELKNTLTTQLFHAAIEEIDIIHGDMLETVEFGEQRNELGDILLVRVSGKPTFEDAY
ncbi:hypothetical protein A6R68_23962, partial [Neotoma lepida]